LGLGLDAGGSQTRWALCEPEGTVLAQGSVAGMSGLQLQSDAGRAALESVLQTLATALHAALPKVVQGQPLALYAGFTGLGAAQDQVAMQRLLQQHLPLASDQVTVTHDMDIAYRAAHAPGEGYLVYAGTGSIAAYIDAADTFHRAGGRGGILGDEGSGYWIAREALAHLWHDEDHSPGAWKHSPMAQRLFEAMGGSDWSVSRQWVYGGDRGAMGRLALQVAAAAQDDAFAHALLLRAGAQLSTLAQCMVQRFGHKPVTFAGRVWLLSPLLEEGLRAALPDGWAVQVRPDVAAHHTAARRAILMVK
jgi:N-acetylglucosamine kinase-like BadF-type ATPase